MLTCSRAAALPQQRANPLQHHLRISACHHSQGIPAHRLEKVSTAQHAAGYVVHQHQQHTSSHAIRRPIQLVSGSQRGDRPNGDPAGTPAGPCSSWEVQREGASLHRVTDAVWGWCALTGHPHKDIQLLVTCNRLELAIYCQRVHWRALVACQFVVWAHLCGSIGVSPRSQQQAHHLGVALVGRHQQGRPGVLQQWNMTWSGETV
jgi:hypothetical protein